MGGRAWQQPRRRRPVSYTCGVSSAPRGRAAPRRPGRPAVSFLQVSVFCVHGSVDRRTARAHSEILHLFDRSVAPAPARLRTGPVVLFLVIFVFLHTIFRYAPHVCITSLSLSNARAYTTARAAPPAGRRARRTQVAQHRTSPPTVNRDNTRLAPPAPRIVQSRGPHSHRT